MGNLISLRLLKRLDLPLLAGVLGIIIISLISIASATHVNNPGIEQFKYVERQSIFAILGFLWAFCIAFFFDYQILKKWSNKLYIFNLFMLLSVMFFGQVALGAQRWIQIGPVTLQPSEFSKVFMIIALAAFVEPRVGKLSKLKDWKKVIPIFLYIFIPFLLVAKQPDLGTGLVFISIFVGMVFVAGISYKLIGIVIGLFLAISPFIKYVLHDYQIKRLLVFWNPEMDPLGAGYHIIQSKIAIGSGMLWGKGLFHGTQSQLNFLPENHTDFIFAVVGEEFGFIGGTILILLYALILWRGIKIAMECKDGFGMLLAVGIVSMLGFHLLVNAGMTMGMMPVTGIPLPMMSYGVSSLLTNMTCIGLLLNIHLRQSGLNFN